MEKKNNYALRQLTHLLHTGVFCLKNEELISYEENPKYNPLHENRELLISLMEKADMQKPPVILVDDYYVYFACIKKEKEYYFIGPMTARVMSRMERHRFYFHYKVEESWEKGLHYHTVMEILQAVGLFAKLITDEEWEDQELVDANQLAKVTKEQEEEERLKFKMKEEEEDIYRHTYQEERKILNMVRDGNVSEAVRMSKEMDIEIGRLGNDELTHWRNLLVVSATLCARAAIEGGLNPYIAYQISGFYINKGSYCKDVTQILTYRNHAVEELAKLVQKQKVKRHTSSYTEQCKDYVRKHFKEKIYLDEIASTLGVSSSYLSRLFRQETGIRFQDYINDVRVECASNLLKYSNESISMIAEYVNFPSQSYFGKVFKERKNMTPRQFREKYKPMEFFETSHSSESLETK